MQYFIYPIDKNHTIKDKSLVNQIGKVLRWRVWDQCIVIDWKWKKDLIEITWFSKKEIIYKIISSEFVDSWSNKIEVRLFQVLPKSKSKWEFLLQKWTELWVTEFIPIISDYCQAKYTTWTDREKQILKEATEQSKRLFLPNISEQFSLNEVFSKYPSTFYVFDSKDFKLPTQFDIIDEIHKEKGINLLIWPEWWFSNSEMEFIHKQKNCILLSLWPNILRLETASLVALSRINLT